ncbi:aldose 1-epimerase family protein [Sphingomonas sp. MMS24-J13]|uniref:aldose 1-epimerase family protein n=1 Tax=Sphingomonas sp. MMS24-J13 TaxID=3238686 RepID=UPI00384E8D52
MADPTPLVSIAGASLSAEINPLGAELHSLRDGEGRDLLWDGDPAFWTGRAPILFPVVGAVAGGVIRVDGRGYPMAKHGFARRKTWTLVEHDAAAATFRLLPDEETRSAYPFDFRLELRFVIDDKGLSLSATLTNPGQAPLPASFGFHPALRWPLPGGAPRDRHIVRFAEPEPDPIRRIDRDGLLRPAPEPSPVEGRAILVRDAMFEDDAMIFDSLSSRALSFGAAGGTILDIAFPNMPFLGIWTKPGAPYLCIEPWHGIADPEDFAGEYRDKPGVIEVAPGRDHIFAMRIDIGSATLLG